MSVTTEFFPFVPGSSTTPVLQGTQFGSATGVPSDGSVLHTIPFGTAYASQVTYIGTTIDQVNRIGVDELTIQVSSVTTSGFMVYVAGGASGSTVTVYWTANGN